MLGSASMSENLLFQTKEAAKTNSDDTVYPQRRLCLRGGFVLCVVISEIADEGLPVDACHACSWQIHISCVWYCFAGFWKSVYRDE